MGLIEPDQRDRVRYALRHRGFKSLVISEPDGWRSDEKEIARDEDYHGVFTKFSNSLKFNLNGAEYITTVKKLYGINASIQLIKQEQHPDTDVWERSYDGFFDLTTYVCNEGVVSVKFNYSGLEQKIRSREKEKIEIERTLSIDGSPLSELPINEVQLDGRSILLRTTFDENTTNDEAHADVNSTGGNTRNQTVGYPLELKGRSHENVRSVIPQSLGTEDTGVPGMMFFAVSDRDRVIKFKFEFSTKLFCQRYERIQWAFYYIQLMKYTGGTNYSGNQADAIILYDLKDNHPWFGEDFNYVMPQFTQPVTVVWEGEITLLAGESLSLEGYLKADMYNNNNAGVRLQALDFLVENFEIIEESYFPASTSKMVLAYDLGSMLVENIAGDSDAFYSEVLGTIYMGYDQDGEASLTGITHGFWVRKFDRLPETDDNKFKQLTTSFKEFREALGATWNLGLGIEKIGFKERVRMEKLEFFYNRNVTVKLPFQVSKVKRTVAIEYYYSGIELGFAKGGEYEEAMGLDEYNAKSTFTTVITVAKNIYRAISPYRGDSYGKEFARRKPQVLDPTLDTKYDQDKFIMDLKKEGNIYKERVWQDDFDQAPSGVFSPETATNLRYSPVNLLRYLHNWRIAAAIFEYPNDYIRYGSSTANSNLKTKIIGGVEYAENLPEGIINREMGRARFIPEFIEFDHIIDRSLMDQIEGTTIIEGKEVMNVYGLFEFKNEDNETERGFLINLKPNGSGRWKLVKLFK